MGGSRDNVTRLEMKHPHLQTSPSFAKSINGTDVCLLFMKNNAVIDQLAGMDPAGRSRGQNLQLMNKLMKKYSFVVTRSALHTGSGTRFISWLYYLGNKAFHTLLKLTQIVIAAPPAPCVKQTIFGDRDGILKSMNF